MGGESDEGTGGDHCHWKKVIRSSQLEIKGPGRRMGIRLLAL